ncbi:hypothetical protein GGR51DRAFT_524034 [Nemania sp. FL0031]|nr:hypothetical protein GGR51DRAFT_524034 [Nemania sp. FL0031]
METLILFPPSPLERGLMSTPGRYFRIVRVFPCLWYELCLALVLFLSSYHYTCFSPKFHVSITVSKAMRLVIHSSATQVTTQIRYPTDWELRRSTAVQQLLLLTCCSFLFFIESSWLKVLFLSSIMRRPALFMISIT